MRRPALNPCIFLSLAIFRLVLRGLFSITTDLIKLNDRGFRITLITILFILAYFTNGWHTMPHPELLVQRVLLSLFTIAAVCEASRFIVIYSHRFFHGRFRLLKRLLVIVPLGVLTTATLLVLNSLLHHYITYGEWKLTTSADSHLYINNRQVTAGKFGPSIFTGFLIFLGFYILYEIRYHFARLHNVEKEKEQLEKEKLKADLHRLKEMVNPHFLFNTLNSLSALISENPRQAEIFLDELTRVYRYLLRNNEMELTTLANELQFIRSYFHLLKTRYGDGIHFVTDIHVKPGDWILPPLTLQLLVENAVKHNRLMKEQPLTIHIFTTQNNELVVSNNIQKKDSPVDSTKVGLQNIDARYRLLQQRGIVVDKTADTFSVNIPLIKAL